MIALKVLTATADYIQGILTFLCCFHLYSLPAAIVCYVMPLP